MNDAGILAILISLFAFFICTPTIAYCFCFNKTKNQYQILVNSNRNEDYNIA